VSGSSNNGVVSCRGCIGVTLSYNNDGGGDGGSNAASASSSSNPYGLKDYHPPSNGTASSGGSDGPSKRDVAVATVAVVGMIAPSIAAEGDAVIGAGDAIAGRAGTEGASGLEKLVEKLLDAGAKIDKGDLTKAGRALEKHGSRPGSAFPQAVGNSAAKNAQGQKALNEILTSKNVSTRPNRFGGQDVIDKASGRGVRYDGNGNMMGFLEP